MATGPSRHGLVVRALVATALGASSLGAATTARAGGPLDPLLCAVTRLLEPVPLADALTSGVSAALVRAQNQLTADQLDHLAEDDTTWLDECARVFVVDEAASPTERATVDQAPAGGVPGDVFDLSSRPGSNLTIHLDFDGATYSGTRWGNGQTIASPPYSADSDPSTFTDAERAQIYLAWQVVAEDFAPFDVNVTTRQPPASALTRSSSADQTYGMPVVVTPTNSVGAGCACGGMAYVGGFGAVGGTSRQPAWIFTHGSGTGGHNMGQVISHEVGHTFGLSHDGTSRETYYPGAQGWAPIMGSSYGQRASQWSRGEYADASSIEDDLALISQIAPVLADDHADGRVGATAIAGGTATAGLIGTRTDVDAFTFTASGPTTLTVAGPAAFSNVDARVTILDAAGHAVATIDAVADHASDESMSAVWSVDLPGTPATYTAVVDGTGHGDPAAPGGYSDYGSIGRYTVTLVPGRVAPPTTTPTTTPATDTTGGAGTTGSTGTGGATDARVDFVTKRLPKARVGRRYRAAIRFTGPVSEARLDWRLPRGLRWRPARNRIVITGTVTRRTTSRFTAEVSGAQGSARRKFRLVVR